MYRLESLVACTVCVSAGIELIMRAFYGPCDGTAMHSLWHCNPESASRAVPQDSLVLTLLYPLIFSILFRGINVQVALCGWCISVICASIAVYIRNSTESIYCLVTLSLISLLCLLELERFSVEAFLDTIAVITVGQHSDKFASEFDTFLCSPAGRGQYDISIPSVADPIPAAPTLPSSKPPGSAFEVSDAHGPVSVDGPVRVSPSGKKKPVAFDFSEMLMSSKSASMSEKISMDIPTPKQQRRSVVLETIGLATSGGLDHIKEESAKAPDPLLELKNMIANVAHDLKTVWISLVCIIKD